jgi:hypothetical protein
MDRDQIKILVGCGDGVASNAALVHSLCTIIAETGSTALLDDVDLTFMRMCVMKTRQTLEILVKESIRLDKLLLIIGKPQ